MRTRINNITFTPGTRSINTGITDLTIDDIRLFVNESQMKVICSSMQKSNIDSIVSGVVTYKNIFPVLAAGDHITFEIDRGDNVAKEVNATANKNEILTKIENTKPDLSTVAKQGSDSAVTLTEVSEKIGVPASGQPSDLFAAIAAGGDVSDDVHNLAQFFGLPESLPQFTYATNQEVIDIVDDVYNAYFPNN